MPGEKPPLLLMLSMEMAGLNLGSAVRRSVFGGGEQEGVPQSNKTNGTFVAAASSVASGKWQKRRRRRPARCCPIDRPASLAPSLLFGGLIRVIAAWCTPGCGKWQCDELPKQQPHLWLPLMMMMTRKTKTKMLPPLLMVLIVRQSSVSCTLVKNQEKQKIKEKKKC